MILLKTTEIQITDRPSSSLSPPPHPFPAVKADLLQRGGVRGGGAGEQCGAAAGLSGQHHGVHRGLCGAVSVCHESGLQAAAQEGGGAVPRARE